MRASVSVLGVILGITQLAAAAPQGESVQAARIAKDRFYHCAQTIVPDYDDRLSPANVVAKAIAVKCQTDARNWVNAMLKHTTRTEATDQFNELMRGEDGNLLGVVLRYRVLKSMAPPLVVTRPATAPPGPALRSQQKAAPSPRRLSPAGGCGCPLKQVLNYPVFCQSSRRR